MLPHLCKVFIGLLRLQEQEVEKKYGDGNL
jgi:hypothetical protein